jgi:hypothetical protein
MEKKLLRLNYPYTSTGEVHIQVRIEAALLIIPVVFLILILLRIYWSCFVSLQISKSLLLFYSSHLSQIFNSLLSQLSRSLLEKMSFSKVVITLREFYVNNNTSRSNIVNVFHLSITCLDRKIGGHVVKWTRIIFHFHY